MGEERSGSRRLMRDDADCLRRFVGDYPELRTTADGLESPPAGGWSSIVGRGSKLLLGSHLARLAALAREEFQPAIYGALPVFISELPTDKAARPPGCLFMRLQSEGFQSCVRPTFPRGLALEDKVKGECNHFLGSSLVSWLNLF